MGCGASQPAPPPVDGGAAPIKPPPPAGVTAVEPVEKAETADQQKPKAEAKPTAASAAQAAPESATKPQDMASLSDLPSLTSSDSLPAEAVRQLSAEIDAELEGIMQAGDNAQAKAMFDKYDKDRSGSLEIKELSALLKSLNFELSGIQFKQYLSMLFKHLDKNDDGSLTWDEFEKFYHKFLASEKVRAKFSKKAIEKMTSIEQKQVARDMFAASDKDDSGKLDQAELSTLLRKLLADVTSQMDDASWNSFITDTIARGDKNADTAWDVEEFINFYLKCLSSSEITQQYEQKVLLRFQESSGELVILDADVID